MIEIDFTTLFQQASMTASDYMIKGITAIDEWLGEGYAEKHPELLAAFMQTAALDYGAAIIAKEIAEAIRDR